MTAIVWIRYGMLWVQVPFSIPSAAVVWIHYGIMAHTDDSHSAQSIQCAICSACHSLAHPYDNRLSNKGCCVVISRVVSYPFPIGERERANRYHHTLLCLVAKTCYKKHQCLWGADRVKPRKEFHHNEILSCALFGTVQFSTGAIQHS